MKFLTMLFSILNITMETPKLYGPFHLFFLIISICLGVYLLRLNPSGDERFIRRFLWVEALIVTFLELYKQIVFSFHAENGTLLFDYQWYAFPFQFCSTPMYIGLMAPWTRGRLHKRLCAYLATYAMVAGICVMAYPSTVFVETMGINLQTMVCHGSMITAAIVLLGTGYVRPDLKALKDAFPVFLALVITASVMNELAYCSGLLSRETFNMFFISPHCPPELPVYSLVQKRMPFPLSVLVYITGFTLAAALVLYAAKALAWRSSKSLSAPVKAAAYPH